MNKLIAKIQNRIKYEKAIAKINIDYRKSLIKELRVANSKKNLKIETYDSNGTYQAMHPSIIDFKKEWNGWRYWMGYTPYTFGNESVENPCIAVSNDLINWKTPKDIINPLENTIDHNYYHWSDIHLIYRKDKDQLECWYRKRTKKPINKEQIYRTIIKNGQIVSKSELMFTSEDTFNKFLSPVIIYDYINSKYQIWVVEELSMGNRLKYYESDIGDNWIFVRDIDLRAYDGYEIWHMDIKKTHKGYEMFYCAMKRGVGWILYTKSKDNIEYDDPIVVIQPTMNKYKFDNKSLYRPSFFIDNNKYNVFYSAESKSNAWGIGHSISDIDSPNKLYGV